MSTAAALRVLVREPDVVRLLSGVQELEPSTLASYDGKGACYTPDGSKVAVITTGRVELFDTASAAKVSTLEVHLVKYAEFSPTGAYLTTAQQLPKSTSGGDAGPEKNVKVWDVGSGELMLEIHKRSITKEAWPIIQWASDDSSCSYAVTNTVHICSREEGFKVTRKVNIKGVLSFAPSPCKAMLAAFTPEGKGQPAVASITDYSGQEAVTISRKSFFRATGSSMLWNSTGSACLFLATCETDATNQSYYGEAKLHYLPADPARADGAVAVDLPKEGPVHDVQWSPAGDYFCVVAGFMPAKVMLFDARCKPVYDLGSGPYNTVRWNPFGRFLALAGFGNLPGDIVFFNKLNKGVCKQMGATRNEAVTAAWSPCGRYLMTATTAPRLRVDNKVVVLNYVGEKVAQRKFDTLFEAQWLPGAAGAFEDRPASPERFKSSGAAAAGGSTGASGPPAFGGGLAGHLARGAATTANGAPPTAKPSGYRPPALRGAGAAATPGLNFSKAYDESSKPGRISSNTKAATPGAEFVSKAAAKNAKKRAAKKNKAGGAGEEEEEQQQQGGQDGAASCSSSGAQQLGDGSAAGGVAEGVAGLSVGGAEGADAAQKRIRALQKKLRQIQQLKERRDTEGAGALEAEQLQKIEAEASVVDEIRSHGGSV